MKRKEFQALTRRYILHHLPDFNVKGDLIFITPFKYLLRAFCFQTSGFDPKRFNVETFIQPLYIPIEHFVFNIGFRLGEITRRSGKWWDITPENEAEVMTDVLNLMKIEGLPFLNSIKSPLDLATHIQNKYSQPESPTIMEYQTIAYSLILAGKPAEGLKELNRFIFLLSEEVELREWEKVMLERAILLRDTLKNQGEKAAIALLEEWRAYTIEKLRLEKFVEH